MKTSSCPFHRECQFHNSTIKTPSDAMLHQFFCYMQYEECEIAQREYSLACPCQRELARRALCGHHHLLGRAITREESLRPHCSCLFPFC